MDQSVVSLLSNLGTGGAIALVMFFLMQQQRGDMLAAAKANTEQLLADRKRCDEQHAAQNALLDKLISTLEWRLGGAVPPSRPPLGGTQTGYGQSAGP